MYIQWHAKIQALQINISLTVFSPIFPTTTRRGKGNILHCECLCVFMNCFSRMFFSPCNHLTIFFHFLKEHQRFLFSFPPFVYFGLATCFLLYFMHTHLKAYFKTLHQMCLDVLRPVFLKTFLVF